MILGQRSSILGTPGPAIGGSGVPTLGPTTFPVMFAADDLVLSFAPTFLDHRKGATGAHVQQLATIQSALITGLCFDRGGNLYTVAGEAPWIEKIYRSGVPAGVFGSAPFDANNVPWDIALISSGGFVVLVVHTPGPTLEIWRLDTGGNRVGFWTVGVDAAALDPDAIDGKKLDALCDSTTVYYAHGGAHIFSFNLATGINNAPFWTQTDPNYAIGALKVRSGGSVINAISRTGDGPKRALAILSDGKIWSDENIAGRADEFHIYLRDPADGAALLEVAYSPENEDTDRLLAAMAAYFIPCVIAARVKTYLQMG